MNIKGVILLDYIEEKFGGDGDEESKKGSLSHGKNEGLQPLLCH
jgi:hypothetical protein